MLLLWQLTILFLAKNFYNKIKKNTIIVDLWNTLNKDKFIFVKK